MPFALVEPFIYDSTTGGNPPYGAPAGLEPYAISPLKGTVHYGLQISALSVLGNGTVVVSVTCSAPHGLTTNDQVSVSGLANKLADGFFSVVVASATSFSYQTFSPIAAGALLTGTSRIVTVIVGLPYEQATIYQVGP